MNKSLSLLALSLAVCGLLLVGCQGNNTPAKAGTDSTATSDNKPTNEPKVEPAKTDAEDVGEAMRHDAYQYYGLGNQKTLVYDFSINGTTEEGTQKCEYQGKVNDKPTYKMVRSGSLSRLGDESLELGADGVSLSGTSMGELDKAALALPATVEIGKSWETKQSITRLDKKVLKIDVTYKVEKMEKLTVPAGDFDCVTLSAKGVNTIDGKNEPFSGTVSYAKGVGIVKLTIDGKDQNSEQSKAVVTLKKVE